MARGRVSRRNPSRHAGLHIGPVVAAVLVAQVQNQAGGVRLDEAAKRRVNLKESSARVHLGRISAPDG